MPDETVILTPSFTYEFVFEVGPDDTTVRAQSQNSASISQLLEGTFRADEVISATVSRVELERVHPPGRTLGSIFETATLDLKNGGEITVGSMSSPPGARRGAMNVNSPDITALFQTSAIRGELELNLAEEETEQHAIDARVRFRIEVEGI